MFWFTIQNFNTNHRLADRYQCSTWSNTPTAVTHWLYSSVLSQHAVSLVVTNTAYIYMVPQPSKMLVTTCKIYTDKKKKT